MVFLSGSRPGISTPFKIDFVTLTHSILEPNGLKINTTLALIGAIVAEFFGSPIKGIGFRISTEVGRFALDMVWAEITIAAITGSLFYGGIVLLEKVVTFWHPSQRVRLK